MMRTLQQAAGTPRAVACGAQQRRGVRLQPARAAEPGSSSASSASGASGSSASASAATATSSSSAPAAPAAAAPPVASPSAASPDPVSAASSSRSPSATSSYAEGGTQQRRVRADATDPIASALSRRWGLAGGLAWVGVLAVGSLGEQIKTRLEVAAEVAATTDVSNAQEVVLPSGVRYTDLRIGGGQQPAKGLLVLVDYVGRTAADGVVFESTRARGKPIVYLFGGRPFTGGICLGVEQGMAGMRAGGKRRITVPPELGFGAQGGVLRPTEHVPEKQGVIPGGAELVYELELLRVSVPPS